MKKIRQVILFFPIEIGLAHITRSLAIAEELHKRGHKVLFALPRNLQDSYSTSPVTFIDIKTALSGKSILLINNFKDESFVRPIMKDELRIIDEIRPDKIVVDFRISALGSAAARQIKTFTIFEGSGLPYGGYIPNPGIPALLFKPLRSAALLFLQRLKNSFLRPLLSVSHEFGNTMDLDTWYKSVVWLLPEASFYLPTKDTRLETHYVGPLSWKGFNSQTAAWLSTIKPNGKTIYITFGGTGFDPEKLVAITKILLDKQYRVVVTTGTICDPDIFPEHPNLHVARFLPGPEVCKRVDAVVCHGGYGTVIQAVHAGKPVISVPYNPDQLIHGWRTQELGLGICVLKLKLDNIRDLLSMDFGAFEKIGKMIDPAVVVSAVDKVFANYAQYETSIQEFTKKYPERDGAVEAADIIER